MGKHCKVKGIHEIELKKKIIRYPLSDFIWILVGVEFIIAAIAYLTPTVRLGYTILAFVWPVLFYLFAQYTYTQIIFFNDRLRIEYNGSLYLKSKEILFLQISRIHFQFDAIGRYGNPYLFIFLKNSDKRMRISMPKRELEQLEYEFGALGISIEEN